MVRDRTKKKAARRGGGSPPPTGPRQRNTKDANNAKQRKTRKVKPADLQWRQTTCGLAAVSGKPGFYECTKTPAEVGMAAYKAYFKDTFSKIITVNDVARIRAEIESRDKENSSGSVAKKAKKAKK